MKFLSHDGLTYFWEKIKNYIDTKYNQLFQSVSNGKTLVASAITDKGISTDATATFETMATNINNIESGVDTSDATAAPSDLISGATAYVNGTKIVGAMPNHAGTTFEGMYHSGHAALYSDVGVYDHDSGGDYLKIITRPTVTGHVDLSSGIVTWIPGLTKAKVQAGLTFGTPGGHQLMGTYTSDATASASDIMAGKTAYVNGSKLTGTGSFSTPFNFPLTISATQPSASSTGHVWVNTSKSISAVKIVESLPSSRTNGTLYFVVGNLGMRTYNYSNSKALTNGGSVNFSIADDDSSENWLVYNQSGIGNMYLSKPIIYSYVNSVLDIETAYMWNGSSWVSLSQNGNYLIMGGASGVQIFNANGDTFTAHSRINENVYASAKLKCSKDGSYIIIDDIIYKRTGDTFSAYYTIPSNFTYNNQLYTPYYSAISGDGNTLVVQCYYSSSGTRYVLLVVCENNGSTFVQSSTIEKTIYTTTTSTRDIVVSYNGDFISFCEYTGSYTQIFAYFKSGNSYVEGNINLYGSIKCITPDDKYIIISISTDSYTTTYSYAINRTSRTLTRQTQMAYFSGMQTYMNIGNSNLNKVITSDNIFIGSVSTSSNLIMNTGWDFANGVQYTVNVSDSRTLEPLYCTMNLNDTRLYYCSTYATIIYSIAIDRTNKIITLTNIGSISYSGIGTPAGILSIPN